MILRRTPDETSADLRERLGDRQAAPQQVHTADLQPGHLAPAQAAERQHEDEGAVLAADLGIGYSAAASASRNTSSRVRKRRSVRVVFGSRTPGAGLRVIRPSRTASSRMSESTRWT